VAAVWWTSVRNALCWPSGLVSVLLYAWIFQRARLYSDALLQLVYAVLLLYGWWNWRRAPAGPPAAEGAKGATSRASRPLVRRPAALEIGLPLAIALPAALALGAFMARHTDAAWPWLDATLTALSLVAQVWMARLLRVNWLLWIGVDLVYVPLYASRQLPTTAALYAVFLVLAVLGWWRWKGEPVAGAPDPSSQGASPAGTPAAAQQPVQSAR